MREAMKQVQEPDLAKLIIGDALMQTLFNAFSQGGRDGLRVAARRIAVNWHYNHGINIFLRPAIILILNLNNNHWAWVIIYPQNKEIHGMNSINSGHIRSLLSIIMVWLEEEASVEQVLFSSSDWKFIDILCYPQQQNGFDCGIFTLMGIEFFMDGIPINFEQSDMPHYRNYIVNNFIKGKIDSDVQENQATQRLIALAEANAENREKRLIVID